MEFEQWKSFNKGKWQTEINVRDFIQKNYTPYNGNEDFLEERTQTTKQLWTEVMELYKKERENVLLHKNRQSFY